MGPHLKKAQKTNTKRINIKKQLTFHMKTYHGSQTWKKPSVPYNLQPYTPKDIKYALYKKSSSSAPGKDGIIYHYLKKMPYIHKILATAFTGIRERGKAPEAWASSNIILIKKN